MKPVVNISDEPLILCRPDAASEVSSLKVAEFALLAASRLAPVSRIPTWKGKRSYEGRWWYSQTSEHVTFASAWERDVLTWMDFDFESVCVRRDPAVVLPSRSSATPPIPAWLVAELPTGQRLLLLNQRSVAHAAALAEIFAGTSIGVWLPGLPSNEQMRTLRWMAGYRFTRFRMAMAVEGVVRTICTVPRPIADVIAEASIKTGCSAEALRGNIYSQLWRKDLRMVDAESKLSDRSEVLAA